MTSYRMNIHFKEEDLKVLAKADQKVVLIKQTDTPVTWVSFKPWQQNTIDWENTFAIYASNSEVQSKTTINKMSDTHATCGVQYDFPDGTFAAPKLPETSVVPNTYYAKNVADDYPAITLGLAQDVVVNGVAFPNNPINSVYSPNVETTSMRLTDQIHVGLMNDAEDSTVMSQIQGPISPVIYEEGESELNIEYDGKTGQFFKVPKSGA